MLSTTKDLAVGLVEHLSSKNINGSDVFMWLCMMSCYCRWYVHD